jgi:hypothetical protein
MTQRARWLLVSSSFLTLGLVIGWSTTKGEPAAIMTVKHDRHVEATVAIWRGISIDGLIRHADDAR